MKKHTPQSLVTRLAATAGKRKARGGDAADRQALARSVLAGLIAPPGAGGPTLEQFLSTAADVDLASAAQLRAQARALGFAGGAEQAAGRPETARVAGRDLLPALDDVIHGLRRCPAAQAGGATAAELEALQQLRTALRGLGRVVDWATDRVRIGQQVLEAWQGEAQASLAGALLLALSQAETEAEWLALVQDASEVLELEEGRLLSLAAVRERNQADREELAEEATAVERDVALLRTLQDLRARRPVSKAVLAEMADHYTRRAAAEEGAGEPARKPRKPRKQPRA